MGFTLEALRRQCRGLRRPIGAGQGSAAVCAGFLPKRGQRESLGGGLCCSVERTLKAMPEFMADDNGRCIGRHVDVAQLRVFGPSCTSDNSLQA